MSQTIATLLIAMGCAAIGVAAIAGGYVAAQAARHDADATQREVIARETQVVQLRRTRTILLGWLGVLEALALGETWRANAARAELGDVSDCNLAIVGDAGVIGTYLFTANILRSQAGRGLPPEAAAQIATLRVNLMSVMAEQERRLLRGEPARFIESAGEPVFFDIAAEPPKAQPATRSR